jgi:hypothetical protein
MEEEVKELKEVVKEKKKHDVRASFLANYKTTDVVEYNGDLRLAPKGKRDFYSEEYKLLPKVSDFFAGFDKGLLNNIYWENGFFSLEDLEDNPRLVKNISQRVLSKLATYIKF